MDLLSKASGNHLAASPEAGHRVFLDWDKTPGAAGYQVLVSRSADGVYQPLREVTANHLTLLIKTPMQNDLYYFLVVPKGPDGEWLDRSNEVSVDVPALEKLLQGPKKIKTLQ